MPAGDEHTEPDRLERIDRSLERIDAHLARGAELIRRNSEAFEAHRRTYEDFRGFLRELTHRHEKAFAAMIARLEEQTETLRDQRREFVRESRQQRREFVEETRAQRSALFRMLDRLDEGGSAAGA